MIYSMKHTFWLSNPFSPARRLGMVLAVVLAFPSCLVPAFGQGGPATVVVARVVERDVRAEQRFVATVRPGRRVTVGSAVNGRVLDFAVNAGDAVAAGQALAQLRIQTINIQIAAAEAELELRKAELAELENGSRPEEIALAKASLDITEANQDYAVAKLTRAKRLYQNGSGVSQDEYEAAQAEALVAQARVAEARSQYQLVVDGPRQERIRQAAARVDFQSQLVEELLDRREKYTMRAPFDGFVSKELTETGAWVQQSTPVAEVVELDPVEIEVFVPENNVRFVTVGANVDIRVEALPGKVYRGTVHRILPTGDSRARTFPVRIRVDNPKVDSQMTGAAADSSARRADDAGEANKAPRHDLLPGMLARVTLPAGTRKVHTMVPKDALQLSGESATIYRVRNGKAESIPVETGPALGSWIAVQPAGATAGKSLSKLAVDDPIVVRGNERLRDGQPVVIARVDDSTPEPALPTSTQ